MTLTSGRENRIEAIHVRFFIDVGSILNQELDQVHLSAPTSNHDGSVAIASRSHRSGTKLRQHSQYLNVALATSSEERSLSIVVGGMIGAVLEKKTYDLGISVIRGNGERSLSVTQLLVWRVCLEEGVDHIKIAVFTRLCTDLWGLQNFL